MTLPPQSTGEDTTLSARVRQFVVNRFNYFTVHVIYFVTLSFIGAGVIYACESVKPVDPEFVDCLFMAVSAMCVTGLASVDFSRYETSSQIVVFLLVNFGGIVWMSVVPVIIRRRYFTQTITETLRDDEERERARHNPEYQALTLVIRISLCIFFTAMIVSTMMFGLYFQFVPAKKALLDQYNLNPWWFAVFNSLCAFNGAGLVQLPDGLISLNDDYYVLGIMMILILIGNTCYPILFRFIVHLLHRHQPTNPARKFLLDHPRKVHTLMFPSLHTRILMFSVVVFTLSEFICFLALDFNEIFLEKYPPHIRALIGIFQAISTRAAGFNTVDMIKVDPAMSLLICILMYISAMPLIAGLRYASESKEADEPPLVEEENFEAPKKKKAVSHTVGGQVGSVLKKNGFILLVCLFILCLSEADYLMIVSHVDDVSDNLRVDIFSIIYEMSSAYGNVGLSLGAPGMSTSLSGYFSVVGKLVIIFVMLAGRHRGLPSSVDRAVSLEMLLGKNRAAPPSVMTKADSELSSATFAKPRKFRLTESLDRVLAGTWGTLNTTNTDNAPRLRLTPNTFADSEAMAPVRFSMRASSGSDPPLRVSSGGVDPETPRMNPVRFSMRSSGSDPLPPGRASSGGTDPETQRMAPVRFSMRASSGIDPPVPPGRASGAKLNKSASAIALDHITTELKKTEA